MARTVLSSEVLQVSTLDRRSASLSILALACALRSLLLELPGLHASQAHLYKGAYPRHDELCQAHCKPCSYAC